MRLAEAARLLRHAVDPVAWCREAVGIAPDPWQERVLRASGDVVLNCGRQVGKSQACALAAAHAAVFGEAGQTILMVAPSLRQSRELYEKTRGAILRATQDGLPESNKLSLTLANGTRVISLPGGDGSTVRGYSASLALLDEAAFLPNGEDLLAVLRPMLATTGGRLVMMSTPLDRFGPFAQVWLGDDLAWERIHVPSTDCPRIPREFLERERLTLGEVLYRREYLAEFTDSANSYFSGASIASALAVGHQLAQGRSESPPLNTAASFSTNHWFLPRRAS